MSIRRVLIVGAGGHAKVVLDTQLCINNASDKVDLLISDDNPEYDGRELMGVKVVAPVTKAVKAGQFDSFHIAVGDNRVRTSKTYALLALGLLPQTIVHPLAVVSRYSTIEGGCFIAAHAIIAVHTVVSGGVIVNHGAVVDHECSIGKFTHIAPNVTIGGSVSIGENCFIGANSTILPGKTIGDNVTVGAGAVVTNNIASGNVVKGIPAK